MKPQSLGLAAGLISLAIGALALSARASKPATHAFRVQLPPPGSTDERAVPDPLTHWQTDPEPLVAPVSLSSWKAFK